MKKRCSNTLLIFVVFSLSIRFSKVYRVSQWNRSLKLYRGSGQNYSGSRHLLCYPYFLQFDSKKKLLGVPEIYLKKQKTFDFSDINLESIIFLNNILEYVLASRTAVHILRLFYFGTLTFGNFEEPQLLQMAPSIFYCFSLSLLWRRV